MSAVVHQYFKKKADGFLILVRVNPVTYEGFEIVIENGETLSQTHKQFDDTIFDDLTADKFENCQPLEFNLYMSGLVR